MTEAATELWLSGYLEIVVVRLFSVEKHLSRHKTSRSM